MSLLSREVVSSSCDSCVDLDRSEVGKTRLTFNQVNLHILLFFD